MRVALAVLAAAALAGCGERGVVRVIDGRAELGRFVSETAYAYFARGAEAEASGQLDSAARAYEAAAGEDGGSPEVWARLGAVYCREAPVATGGALSSRAPLAGALSQRAPLAGALSSRAPLAGALPPGAAAAFDRALEADPAFGPTYRERARCLVRHGAAPAAVADADRALALDPDDLDSALVRAEALERAGRGDDARRALRAVLARRPHAVEPWSALLELARRAGDAPLAREAAGQVATLAALRSLPELPPLAGVDAALRAGDLAEAQRRALRARLPGAEVALRAAALGLAAPAQEQAALILGADPSDTSARIALAAAADLRGDVPALGDAMRAIPRRSTRPSPLGRLLFAEVLGRRVDVAAARAWLGPEPTPSSDDALLNATDKRVRAALAGP